MKKNNLKRFLASLLAVLMLASVTGVSPAVFAAGNDAAAQSEETAPPVFQEYTGEVLIKSGWEKADILKALADAFVQNKDSVDTQAIEWTYKCVVKGTYRTSKIDLTDNYTKEAREAVVPVLTGLTVTESYCYHKAATKYGTDLYAEATYVYPALADNADGVYELYANGESVGTINKVSKYSTTLVLKESATITYNKDAAAEKEAIVANLVDYTSSVLPTGTTADNFTVEIYKGSILGYEVWKDIPDEKLDAGDGYTIRVSYKGNDDYKASASQTATVNVTKAPVSISMKAVNTLYAGNEVDPATFYTVNPEDSAIDVYIFFIGINSNGESCVNVKFTPKQEKVIDAISDIQKSFGVSEDQTLYAKLRSGMTVGELKEMISKVIDYVDNPVNNWILEKLGVNVDSIKNIVKAFEMLTSISKDTVIGYGTPAHAGVYQAFAVAPETKNYESGKGTGSLIILKNWKNIKLEKNPVLNSGDKANTITVSQAEELKAGNNLCILTKDDKPLNSASVGSIHYWFTGVNKIYAKSTMPTAPGKYIVTASVRGGDFFAFPKTFSFTIVADPTSNT